LGNGRETQLSKTSTALKRFGVGLLSAATVSVGITALAPVANAATADITGLTIAPTSATSSTGENPCQLYTIDVTESGNNTDGTLTVQLQPTGGINSQFCGGDFTGDPAPTNGAKDSTDIVIGGDNQVTIGVNEVNTAQGQIAIKAFPQNTTTPGTPASGAPVANATLNILTADAQNDVVTQLSVSPTSASGTEGNTETFTVTATNGNSSVVKGAEVYYTVKSSQGNSVGQDNVDCGATDDLGTVDCVVTVPATTSVQSGPYTVTFKVPQNAAGEHNGSAPGAGGIPATNSGPTTTATLNAIAPAATNSVVFLDCGTAATNHYAPWWCEDSGATRSESLTATVLSPASSSATTATVPTAGVEVKFFYDFGDRNGGSLSTFSAGSCVTASDGTCSTTLNRAADNTGAFAFDAVYAEIVTASGTADSSDANANDTDTFVDYGEDPFESPATNIAGGAAQNGTTGGTKLVTFNVSNQYGNSANETCFTNNFDLSSAAGDGCDSLAGPNAVQSTSIPVAVTVTGAGSFTDGTTTKTVNATNGQVQVVVTSRSNGTSTVTANLDPASTDCSVAAPATGNSFENDYFQFDPKAVAKAGNCSATSTVTWSGATTGSHRVIVNVHLSCFSPKRHVVKCVAQLSRPISGVTVVFRNAHGTVVGRDVTNAAGKAVMKLRGLKSHRTHRYHAHAKRSARTFAADSNTAKVTVS